VQLLRRNLRVSSKLEPVIDPALEKPLLNLHRAMDVNSFWNAVRRLLSASLVNRSVGLSLQQNPGLPVIARWTRPMPGDFFVAEPLRSYVVQGPRKKFVRLSDLFPSRASFGRSLFFRRYLLAKKCAHGVALFFWKRQRVICLITILRTAEQGDFSKAEMELLRQLYPQFLAALRRIESLERERSVRADFEEFLRRLPLPTIVLRWNLKPIYQNPAAREFCVVWMNAQPQMRSKRCTDLKEEQVHHPRLPHLRATIHLRQIKSAGVARPHFLIECEDVSRNGNRRSGLESCRLPALARLTRREQAVARLVCNGQSNKEIADATHLSVAMVKKHVHAIFRKLEVPSRSRLVALML